MEKIYNKLVRDKIPEIIKNNGENPIFKTLNNNEYKIELLKKLEEECKEVINSTTKEETLEECADVLQVINDILSLEGYTEMDLIKTRDNKKQKRGGFSKKLFLEKVK